MKRGDASREAQSKRSKVRRLTAIFLHTQRGWTPQRIADALGLHLSLIYKYTKGHLTPEYREAVNERRYKDDLIPVDEYMRQFL